MIKSRLQKHYSISELVTKLNNDFNESLSEKDIYEYAYDGHIQLSLIIPKDLYYGFIYDNKNLKDIPKDTPKNETNTFLHEDFTFQEIKAQDNYQTITDIWDIPASTHDNEKSSFLSALLLAKPDWNGNHYASIKQIELIDPIKEKYAIVHKAKHNDKSFWDLTWSLNDDDENKASLIIKKENLDKFINMFNQDNKAQDQQTKSEKVIDKNNEKLNPRKYNNLVALIGFLLKYPNEIPNRIDDHTIIIDKLLKSFQTKNYNIYEKETLTDVIKDALRLIQERGRSN